MFNDLNSDLGSTLQTYYEALLRLLPKLAVALIILLVFVFLAARIAQFTRKKLSNRLDDPLLAKFLARIIRWSVIILGIMLALNAVELGDLAGGLLAGAGVSAFVIGFAFKDIGENFLAGIMLAFSRPFNVGHTIETGDVKGNVVSLDLRNTQVKTFDGKDVFVPNSFVVKNPLINYTIDGFLRKEFKIGLDYGSDVNNALKILLDVLNSIPGILKEEKAPSVSIGSLGDSALILTAYYWLDTFDKDVSGSKVQTEAINRCLQTLTKAGYYLPGNILELKNYSSNHLAVSQST